MTQLIRAASLQGYEALARSVGVDPVKAMRRVRLSRKSLADPDSLIPYLSNIILLEQTALQGACPDFGLRLAKMQGIGVLGQLSVLIQHAATLSEALSLAARYLFVHSPAVKVQVTPVTHRADLVDLVFRLDIAQLPACPQTLELSLGILVNGIEAVSQGSIAPLLAQFPHGRLGPLASYQRTLGCPCQFNAAHAAIRIETQALGRPFSGKSEQIQQFARDYLDTYFGDPSQHFADHMRSMLRRFLSTGMGNQRDIAGVLSIHPRTLQRRLAGEGENFEDLVDDIRKEQLLSLLQDATKPTLTQIAMILGYSEQSSLIRACRRWYGCTPTALIASKTLPG